MGTVDGSSIRLKLSPKQKKKVWAKHKSSLVTTEAFLVGVGLVLLVSLAFSLGNHFLSVITQVVKKHVSVCLWQPKFSIDHAVSSKVIWLV